MKFSFNRSFGDSLDMWIPSKSGNTRSRGDNPIETLKNGIRMSRCQSDLVKSTPWSFPGDEDKLGCGQDLVNLEVSYHSYLRERRSSRMGSFL